MKLTFTVMSLLLVTNAFAALPPFGDSVRQVEAVIQSQDLAAKVSGRITTINSLGNLTYEVNTEFCQAKVTLVAHIPSHPGPTSYTVRDIIDASCE